MSEEFKNPTPENEVLEDDKIVLTDEEGNEVEFEFLDSIEHGDATYVVLLPTNEEDDAVVIMELEEGEEENEDNLLSVEDPEILEEVYTIFKERNSDLFDFED